MKPWDNPHDYHLAASPVPRRLQYVGIAVFVVIVGASGVFSITEHWRRATFALGVAMLWLAALRATCDSTVLGVLAVRSRAFDIGYSVLLGAAMIFLASSVDSLGS